MKVLVVDDNRLNLKVSEEYLKRYFPDFEVHLCQDPQLVESILEQEAIDILLLDIVMPIISGTDILKQVRACPKYRDMQILMLTSITDMESFDACFDLGANDYLRKPIDTTVFHARIRAAATTRRNSLLLHEMYEKVKEQNNELKSVNIRLKDTQFHLIQSEKMAAIGELAAGVAHEINNPIGYVGSNLETMSTYLKKMREFISYTLEQLSTNTNTYETSSVNTQLDLIIEKYKQLKIRFISDDLEDVIKDSQDGIQKVAEIVKSLRNFARSGTEDEKNFSLLDNMIHQVLLIARNESKYVVNINFENTYDGEVYCNNGQIGQVLLNILINAIHAIKSQQRPEKGLITIRTFIEEDYICISIRDDGPGIPEAHLSKIFNPFFTTKEVGEGTGLGLSISHDIIVNKHKGILNVTSTLGDGTEFIIKLPKNIEDISDML